MRVPDSIKKLFARLGAAFPHPLFLRFAGRLAGIQITAAEMRPMVASLKRKRPCNLLVFGLGFDSIFWTALNAGGKTVFLEAHDGWYNMVLKRSPHLRAHLVRYGTRIHQWRELLDTPERLTMEFPQEVENTHWDVILVDAPSGWNAESTGRMKSIFAASRLADAACDVFVHDCDREVEKVYADRYLRPENLRAEIGLMRHYRSGAA